MNDPNIPSIIEAAKGAVEIDKRIGAVTVDVDGLDVKVPVVLNGQAPQVVSVESQARALYEAAGGPPRRTGEYHFDDLASLVAWSQRFTTEDSAAYFTAPDTDAGDDGSVKVVVDDLPKSGSGARRALSASVGLALSDSLKRWVGIAGAWRDAATFCDFVEEHVDEITTADVVSLTQNVGGKSEQVWKRTVDDNGGVRMVVEDSSAPSTRVPRRFKIAAPTFSFDGAANVAEFQVALRCKVEKGRPYFQVELVDLAEVVAACVRVAMQSFKEQVPGCATYLGCGVG